MSGGDDWQTGELSQDDADEIIDLEFADIDQNSTVAELHRWYFNAVELADDVVAQIEANKVSDYREGDWVRRATGILIGLKKKAKRIKRGCAELNAPLPDTVDLRQRATIQKLEQQNLEARSFERKTITDWLRAEYGEAAAPMIEGIDSKAHYAFRRTVLEREA